MAQAMRPTYSHTNRHGSRPPAEYENGEPRRRVEFKAPPAPDKSPHIDLRVFRLVEADPAINPNKYAWNDFLDTFSRDNHAKGRVSTLGSMAVTFVKATEMNSMLLAKNPNDYNHPKRKIKLFNRVSEGLSEFMRQEHRTAWQARLEELAAEHEEARAEKQYAAATIDERNAWFEREFGVDFDDDEFDEQPIIDETTLTPEERLRLAEHKFSTYSLAVKGVDRYGTGYGLDLSLNEVLYEERMSIKWYLGSIGLNTTLMDSDWEAHASFFEPFDHTRRTSLTYHADHPDTLMFSAPEREQLIIAR